MIHVHKDFDAVPKSLQLTEEEYELLKQGKELDKSYYEQDVLDALTEVYGGKCGYCETSISSYDPKTIKVGCYRPISHYFWLYYEWSNLMLICPRCQTRQKIRLGFPIENEKNRLKEPQDEISDWRANSKSFFNEKPLVINPEIDKPEDYLCVGMDGILYPKNGSLKGLNTIKIFDLNRTFLVWDRKRVIDEIRVIESKNNKDIALKEAKRKIDNDSPFKLTYKSIKDDIESCREDFFVKEILIKKVRHIKDLSINVCEKKQRHIILTGKNGSGKTSILEALKSFFTQIFDSKQEETSIPTDFFYEELAIESKKYNGIFISFNRRYGEIIRSYKKGNFIVAYFDARRKLEVSKVDNILDGFSSPKDNKIGDEYSDLLLKYLTHIKINELLAEKDENFDEASRAAKLFNTFHSLLIEVFEDKNLKLDFNTKTFGDYNFKINITNRDLFDFNTLADGYSSVLKIIVELILRMQSVENTILIPDIEGLVLIDEIDAHLHVELQKKIMPLLTTFFPKIQFIVTTHSPFVLNSIEGAIVYDLETHKTFESDIRYSAKGIIETYFEVNEYSEKVMRRIEEYRKLSEKENPTEEEAYQLSKLEFYFENVPSFVSPELKFIAQDIKLKQIERLHSHG